MGRAVLVLMALTFCAGCAKVRPCPLQGTSALVCRAERGDQLAQLQLGRAFETGKGVPVDFNRAVALYRSAAAATAGTTYVYSPPVGSVRGQVIPVRIGPHRAGLAEAKYRLGLLYASGRGVEMDADRAYRLMREAQKEGYHPY